MDGDSNTQQQQQQQQQQAQQDEISGRKFARSSELGIEHCALPVRNYKGGCGYVR